MPLVRTEMIAPTDHYKYFPALSPAEAADMVADAIAKRQKKASTTLGRMSEVTYATVPRVQDAVVNAGYKLFPDTTAAKPDTAPPPDTPEDEPSAEQRAFARATRGVHW
jgi:hypothetical protein